MQRVPDGTQGGDTQGFSVTEGYRSYVAWLMFSVAMFNFVDRQIFMILLEPIKQDFNFTDAQLGLLSGLAFAVLYSILGIPIARLADRRNRVNLMCTALFVWSLFTVFTGMARNFMQLFLMRVGVGIGEAGCSPTAYSLLGDYFDKRRRTRAITIFMMGIYGGMVVGYLAGAILARHYGWRLAFFLVGIPGVLLALLLKLSLREPPRGFSDGGAAPAPAPPLLTVLRKLAHKKTFIHLALAGG